MGSIFAWKRAITSVAYVSCIFFAIETREEVYSYVINNGNSVLDTMSYIVLLIALADILEELGDRICPKLKVIAGGISIIFFCMIVIMLFIPDLQFCVIERWEMTVSTIVVLLTGILGLATEILKCQEER